MTQLIKQNYSFVLSVFFHAAIVFFIFINWQHHQHEMHFGTPQLSIPAYIYQHAEHEQSVLKSERDIPAPAHTPQIRASQNQASQAHHDVMSSPAQKAIVSGDDENMPALIALLHAAIQSHQHYPDSAMQMEREGKTKVMFVLYPNGIINHLKIINSSGTTALDQAALAAINDSVPFKDVRKFLTKPQAYQITVSFELT